MAKSRTAPIDPLPGQIVLVLQGGGALGAYQLGVFQALHEAGIEPDWVVGTSIGAINGAIIAGNPPQRRMSRLHDFWGRMEIRPDPGALAPFGKVLTNMATLTEGLPGFFRPNPASLLGQFAPLGIENAAYYSTVPLRDTLGELIDLNYLDGKATRLTVGAVNALSGTMTYFDTRHEQLNIDHVMASCALPPAFPAVRIDGEPYWDGGIYSNTPTEVVMNDNPRHSSVIFAVQLWNPAGQEPASLWQVSSRQKDIQYSSRSISHVAEQQKIHKLRHIIRELVKHVPQEQRDLPEVEELAAWGCSTTMHLIQLTAPLLGNEDHTRDIDFTHSSIAARRDAGHADAWRAIEAAPWKQSVDPRDGVVIHEIS